MPANHSNWLTLYWISRKHHRVHESAAIDAPYQNRQYMTKFCVEFRLIPRLHGAISPEWHHWLVAAILRSLCRFLQKWHQMLVLHVSGSQSFIKDLGNARFFLFGMFSKKSYESSTSQKPTSLQRATCMLAYYILHYNTIPCNDLLPILDDWINSLTSPTTLCTKNLQCTNDYLLYKQ